MVENDVGEEVIRLGERDRPHGALGAQQIREPRQVHPIAVGFEQAPQIVVVPRARPAPAPLFQLAGVLEGVISQRLLPRADGEGRVLAAEVLRPSYAIRNCIRERKMEQVVGLMEIGFKEGNRTIDQSLTGLLESGLITREEAFFNARERALFAEKPKAAPKPKSIWNS